MAPLYHLLLLLLLLAIAISIPTAYADIVFQFFFTVKSDGTIVRTYKPNPVPASLDGATHVQSADVVINPAKKLSGRLYRPMNAPAGNHLPVLIYFHGGGFSIGSAFDADMNTYMNKLSSMGNVIILSVDYHLAPEHHVKDIYDDGYDAVTWISDQATGKGSSPDAAWMKEVANYNLIYVGGQSSGGNIAHNVAMRIQELKPAGLKLAGLIPIHPYFLTVDPLPSLLKQPEGMMSNITGLWKYICPGTTGLDDPRVNPSLEPDLQILKPAKVLICVAELDGMIDAVKAYYDALKWNGVDTEYFISKGQRHIFDNFDPNCPDAIALHAKIASFMK